MKNKTKKACIDIDGVLADFEGAFCQKFGWEKRNLVSLKERYPERGDEIDLFVYASRTYECLDIIQIGIDITRFLESNGFEIYIVTARPKHATQVTGLWLKQNRIPFHYLITGRKDKVSQYVSINPFMIVEDLFDIARKSYSHGLHSFLVDQPWNFSINSYGVRRIRTFEKFLAEFNEIS